jgi:hypothetical protein
MEQVAEKVAQEYWRPAVPARANEFPVSARSQGHACSHCGAEFVVGAQYCHSCGGERKVAIGDNRWLEVLDFENIRHNLGLSVGSLIAFVLGMICGIVAMITGFVYSANTLVDWQAVQTWRIEWLLAAIAAFVAGILLKKQAA